MSLATTREKSKYSIVANIDQLSALTPILLLQYYSDALVVNLQQGETFYWEIPLPILETNLSGITPEEMEVPDEEENFYDL